MRNLSIIAILFFVLVVTSACSNAKTVQRHSAPKLQDKIATTQLYFRFDSDKIQPRFFGTLDDAVAFLNSHPRRIILIEGYADKPGDDRYNLDLGDRRARAVKAYLVARHVNPNQIVTVTFGEDVKVDALAGDSLQKRRVILMDAGE